MINGLLIAAAVLLGYGAMVACSLAMTFGITSASPTFVTTDHKISGGYKRLQAVVWLACSILGGFVAAAVAQGTYPWIVGALLIVTTLIVLWMNTWESRQRGLAYQILLSFVSTGGVIAGFVLATRLLKIELRP